MKVTFIPTAEPQGFLPQQKDKKKIELYDLLYIVNENMKLFRDKSKMTRFLILYKSAVEKPSRLADLASELNMTEQAISNYVSEIEEDGLMDRSGASYRPTSKGMELVREIISQLGTFLKEANQNVDFISTCTAIADEEINEGEKIGLYMKDGFLHASLKESSSTGTALNHAKKEEPLKVGGLEGIIEMGLGKVNLIKTDITGNISTEEKEEIKDKIQHSEPDRLSIMGEMQYGICNSIGFEPDICFAPVESSMDAVEKGLDVTLLVSDSDLDEVLEKLNSRNKDRDEEYRIKYEVL